MQQIGFLKAQLDLFVLMSTKPLNLNDIWTHIAHMRTQIQSVRPQLLLY